MARSAGGRVLEQGTEQAVDAAEELQRRIQHRKMGCSPVEAIGEDDAKAVAERLREAADMIEAGADSMRY